MQRVSRKSPTPVWRGARVGARLSQQVIGKQRDTLRGIGWEYAHAAIDVCSRFAKVKVLSDEKRHTAIRLVLRTVRALVSSA